MTEMNRLQDEELRQVVGGKAYKSAESVQFSHQLNEHLLIRRSSDGNLVDVVITDRGIEQVDATTFYAAYYVDVLYYLGDGWLHDDGGIKFENRCRGTIIKSGL